MTAKETVLHNHKALLNGSGELTYFEDRGIKEETVKDAWIGYDAGRGAFTYPAIAKGGGLLAIHYKSKARDAKRKRRTWWGGYADDLPPKGCGKKPDDPAKVIPFGMETLEGVEPRSRVLLLCGEEDALSARQAGYVAVSQAGAGLLEPAYAIAFANLVVVVLYDAGEEGEAQKDALTLLGAGAAEVRVVEWSPDAPHGADVNGRLVEDPDSFEEWLTGMIEGAKPLTSVWAEKKRIRRDGERDSYGVEDEVGLGVEAEGRKPTQAELLIKNASDAEFFHTPAGDAYATVPVGDHLETHAVKSKGFKRWLVRRFYEQYNRPPGTQALQEALGLLEARALFDGVEREVFVRIAEHDGAVYVDLANAQWEVVEITGSGWRVIPSEATPVRFRRSRGMLPLPVPTRDGLAKELRRFINIPDEDEASWRLLLAWLVQALRPKGPYPVLILQGEQGSAKSTVERLLRALLDPSTAPLRTTPRTERDLIIAATNSWCVAFDNISTLPPWLSDALCRLSTGGGFSARELYTDSEEVLFDATRPVIVNGITDVATRPDLLDRALVVRLPPIPEESRTPEAELWHDFDRARPAILGSLFDAVAGALGTVQSVRLEKLPRMADFAVWATAAESSLGWEPGGFQRVYSSNRQEATETALDADLVAAAVREFMQGRDQWTGTAGELWTALNELVDGDIKHTRAWPGAPNALSGRLKRLAPALRGIGIEYGEDRNKATRKKTLTKIDSPEDRHHRHHRHPEEEDLQNNGSTGDDPKGAVTIDDGLGEETVTDEIPANEHIGDGDDEGDGDSRVLSTFLPLLTNPPEWLRRQTDKHLEDPQEGTLKALCASVAHELLGNPRRGEDVRPAIERWLADRSGIGSDYRVRGASRAVGPRLSEREPLTDTKEG